MSRAKLGMLDSTGKGNRDNAEWQVFQDCEQLQANVTEVRMKVLEYRDLNIRGVESQYRKVITMLERDDFRSAEVKKLSGTGDLYRAKLDVADRLLFTVARFGDQRHALILEVIRNHEYEKSRFLRGARIDETKIPNWTAQDDAQLPSLNYLNSRSTRFNFLNKVLSFDDSQEDLFDLSPPLIVIGSAGSGKTALTLEKMKEIRGDILYVTLSAFLSQNARNLYYAHHYENENQNVDFLSYQEFLETIRVPEGREITYPRFKEWFARHQRELRFADAHKLFEEFKGVLTGAASGEKPWLSREEYLGLGIRQSVFLQEERVAIYGVFEKYLVFLRENRLYDSNIISHGYLAQVQPRYDFVVVDEVQDLTNVQLSLILRFLKKPEMFLLCGDSNQIVHPNFFSWTGVKSMFYLGKVSDGDASKLIHILRTNYRNSPQITAVANRLLRIKQRRFGSIDRESNYLVESVSGNPGEVELLIDNPAVKRELDEKTRKSTQFAVLVMREEHKALAREFFRTPLLFSVQEAKGLEYENVILFNFVSGDREAFRQVVEGVAEKELTGDLSYSRGKDKSDKSLEVYKFFVNSLYVAMTRAVRNLYLIESDVGHEAIRLLDLKTAREKIELAAQKSSLEEWQREARRLELQGKDEQAAEIRKQLLQHKPVPWSVMDSVSFHDVLEKATDPIQVSKKPKEQLIAYGSYYREPRLFQLLISNYEPARQATRGAAAVIKKQLSSYEGKNFKEILNHVDLYGVDFRNPFNQSSLMCAARTGNVALVEALLERGANPALLDNYGRTAFHLALLEGALDPQYAKERLGAVYPLLCPPSESLNVGGRLVKLDAHTIEFTLFQLMVALFHEKLNTFNGFWVFPGFDTAEFNAAFRNFPENVVTERRKKRSYLSGVLSRNEIERDYRYNRKIFVRTTTGCYSFNPLMEVRAVPGSGKEWIPLYDRLGAPLMLDRPWERTRHFFEKVEKDRARLGML